MQDGLAYGRRLTLTVTGRYPAVSIQFEQIRTRAAVTSTGVILLQASFAASCRAAVGGLSPKFTS